MAGLTSGKTAKFVKRFGDVGGELRRAATQYADEVASGAFPGRGSTASSGASRTSGRAVGNASMPSRPSALSAHLISRGYQPALQFHLLLQAAAERRQHQLLHPRHD